MHRIEYPETYEICKFDGVNEASVYIGTFSKLIPADKLSWKKDEPLSDETGVPFYSLTLDDIKRQIKNAYGGKTPMITIFINRPLSGEVLQYGNYGDEWWQVGALNGYA